MAHVYASLDAFKRYMVDRAEDFGTDSDQELLGKLESVSRSADEFCRRGGDDHPLSGFGPRLGTNRYDGNWYEPGASPRPADRRLKLVDDLLAITDDVTVVQSVGATALTYVLDTDYVLRPYDRTPYRELQLRETGGLTWRAIGAGITITGKWGYQDVRVAAGTVTSGINASTETIPLDQGEAGQTILIGDEQVYLRAVVSNDPAPGVTATGTRGSNGTTAASHLAAAAVEVYTYPGPVVDFTLAIAQRRRKSRDAGLTQEFGGGAGVPFVTNRDTERSIARELLWQYVVVGV